MTRTKCCLIISLVLHMLAAVVAQYAISIFVVPIRRVIAIGDLPDALSAEIIDRGFTLEEIMLRRPMVRAQDEINEAPKPAASYLALRELMKIELREKILAIDYSKIREEAFSPVFRWAPLSQPPVSASAIVRSLLPKPHQIRARSAGRPARSFSHRDFKQARELREIAYRKIMLEQKVRSFFAALIDRNFHIASRIAGGRYKDVDWEETRYADLTEIISIHEPYQQSQSKIMSGIEIFSGQSRQRHLVGAKIDMLVPYEVRSASGQLIGGKIIMRWEISAGRWFFEGGI